MKTPGITVRPLINMADGEGFNEVFFDNVRVPKSGLLGEMNRGWYIATTTLDFERSAIGGTMQALRTLEELTRFAKTERDRVERHGAVGQAAGAAGRSSTSGSPRSSTKLLSYRVVSMQERGLVPNYESSINKVLTTEYVQRQARVGLGIMGMYGGLWGEGPWAKLRGRFSKSYVATVGIAIAGRHDRNTEEHHRHREGLGCRDSSCGGA